MAELINVTTKMFFDRPLVVKAIGHKATRVLSSTGAFARTVMRRGMRRRKATSAVGQYPSAHAGQLKELIFFGYDPQSKGVVIGPTFFKNDNTIASGATTVPQLINEGGRITRRVRKRGGGTQVVSQVYRPRPFVALTAPIAAKKLADNMEKFALK